MSINWSTYKSQQFYDNLLDPEGGARPGAEALIKHLQGLNNNEIRSLKNAAQMAILNMGITFTVYTESANSIDRAWPFDLVPRLVRKQKWQRVSEGLKQRVLALNLFIDDLYHEQKIIKDGVFPAEVLAGSRNFRPECVGVSPPHGVWAHICGSDLIEDDKGTWLVLEDNLRVPSGVSYMLENRLVMKRVFPELFSRLSVMPVDDYPLELLNYLSGLSERENPEVVILTPGIYNSAYFEHSYLAQQMGVELVQGPDLFTGDDDNVYARTISGPRKVDVIYRRVDDMFLDPEAFRKDSTLGVAGLLRAWKKGNVAIANAPGAGVADDKVVYAFVPKFIRYYLDQDPLVENVPTYLCMYEKERAHVLENLQHLVVKPANESGGYGMLIGPKASKREIRKFAELILADPRNYIAQPLVGLSTSPTFVGNHIEPRHVDLRPFILSGADGSVYVTSGGLTRVALRKGSTVVNSSQGGGSKDTWIIEQGGQNGGDA